MKPWCEYEQCQYYGRHDHPGGIGDEIFIPRDGEAYVLVEQVGDYTDARIEVTPELIAERDKAIERLASALDLPPEALEIGREAANHWTALMPKPGGMVMGSDGWCAPSDVVRHSEGWQDAAWATFYDPGAPPANLDGPPEKCEECAGTGRVKFRCECPECVFPHETDCDDCQGSGMVTPWTTEQWNQHVEWVRAGRPFAVRRGGIRWPTLGEPRPE